MSTWSPETTWIPAAPPHEIVDKVAGQKLVNRVNRALQPLFRAGMPMVAKLDGHHGPWSAARTWCVEVVPVFHFDSCWLEGKGWPGFRRGLALLFRTMRAHGLVPSVMTRQGNEETHWPGGGCHIHWSADLFGYTDQWYSQMERFHRNLATDYANRPYIRWLFSHWFADGGSRLNLNEFGFQQQVDPHVWPTDGTEPKMRPATPEELKATIWDVAFSSAAIAPRFMPTGKNSYLTFEFRVFSMVESPDELRAVARFVQAWVSKIERISRGTELLPVTLTLDEFQSLKGLRKGRAACHNLLDILGLPWSDYAPFFDRNYARRVRFGKFV